MKKLCIYIIFMVILIVFIPLLMVRNFSIIQEQEKTAKESTDKPLTINVYLSDQKKTVKMNLEDYLIGVVAAEMPASFEMEALKAQAVAARTYAMGRAAKLYGSSETAHNGADVCTNPAHCQAWISKETAMKRWGLFSAFKYWNKICRAVSETSGQIIEYNGVVINPLFHSNSGGHTENSEDVWDGTAEPYLRGVESPGEDTFSEYKTQVVFDQEEMVKKLKEFNPEFQLKTKDLFSAIKIKKYSSGDRVMEMEIGNIKIKGTDFRKIFQLKSANFKLSKLSDGKIDVTTLGYGHGVGMSQCGADYLAKEGYPYSDILKYYYKGVTLNKLGDNINDNN
ncbi:stage II sporulation protein D [Ruminiclostridium cellobioparum]|uniref:stage II sporulation protein D n=1 Tax=Ruminiclostridium cellobioparum TaxID=29355 RepID=UPI0004826925|nr:stage II sporulation protein D [Ruminiclostridium cellobioparum]